MNTPRPTIDVEGPPASAAVGRTPPRAALVLGYAGLLPPLVAISVEALFRAPDLAGLPPVMAIAALGYIALILSFLGGQWWGIAATRIAPERLWGWLAMAVAPSLVAAGAFFSGWLAAPPRGTAMVLAAALTASLLGDRRLEKAGLGPPWWMTLRIPLSCGLALEALAVAGLA